ncbi:MAG: RcnB family protein [Caulobacteraceae bacterium]
MKRLLLVASCIALVLPSLTIAQMTQDRTHPAADQQKRPAKPGNGGPHKPGPGNGGSHRPGAGPSRPGIPGGGAPNRPNPGAPNRPNPGTPGRPTPGRPNRPGIPNRPGNPSSPGWRPSRPNFGWNGRRYRGGAFRYPPGFAYRRWSRGQFLPFALLGAAYYINNYAMMGLEPPPFGYRWVRYGPDALLVDVTTREVVGVVYNVFY